MGQAQMVQVQVQVVAAAEEEVAVEAEVGRREGGAARGVYKRVGMYGNAYARFALAVQSSTHWK